MAQVLWDDSRPFHSVCMALHIHAQSHTFSRACRNAESVLLYVLTYVLLLPFPSPHSVPSAPLNLTVSAIGRRSINVTWSPPANPNGILLFYQLEYSIVGQSSMTLDVPAESLAASLVELTPAQVYQVTVRANTSVGFGDRSELVRATTGMDSECDHSTPHPQHTTLHATPTAHNITCHTHSTQHYMSHPQHITVHTTPTHGMQHYTPHLQHTTLQTTHTAHNTTHIPPPFPPPIPLSPQPDPSAPENLRATNVTGSANAVNISWAPPLEPNGIILVYEIRVEGSSTPRNRREADMTVFGRTTQNVSNITTSVIVANLSEWRGDVE